MTQEKLPHRKELCLQSDVTIQNSYIIIKNVGNMKFLYRRMKKTGMTGGM